MEVFVKSFVTYRIIKKATVISSTIVLDSLEKETSTVTVRGTGINRSDAGNWLIIDGSILQIQAVKPESDRTILTLGPPLDAFTRLIELTAQPIGQTIGGFVAQQLQDQWSKSIDPMYSMPYLVAVSSDDTAFVPPEVGDSGCFSVAEYCRLMRKSYRIAVTFSDLGNALQCHIFKQPVTSRQISFEDGRSRLQSVDYSNSGIAKLTVLHDVSTGEKDANGDDVFIRDRSIWYLAEDGSVSQLVPARRAAGKWETIYIQGNKDVEAKVVETFAKNKTSHKLEFWSEIDLAVHENCTFMVYGELLHSYISHKRKSNEDKRFYYKSGELATSATEKLRGAMK